MSTAKATGAWRLVKVPAIVTLIVTAARLCGELLGLSPLLFGTAAGGGFALVGIGWLIPIFGAWFGWRIAGGDRDVEWPGVSAALHMVGFGALALGLFLLANMELRFPQSLLGLAVCGVIPLAIALRAWPAMFVTGVLYGLAARLPIVALTFVLVPLELGTHYEKLPPGIELDTWQRATMLAATQILLWVPATVVIGGFFGSAAAGLRNRRPAPNAGFDPE